MASRFFVYIIAGGRTPRPVLYAGVTNDLERRLAEHRIDPAGFAARYNVGRLVFFESFSSIHDAIAREKETKGWSRHKKIALIRTMNPYWRDLAPRSRGRPDREPGWR